MPGRGPLASLPYSDSPRGTKPGPKQARHGPGASPGGAKTPAAHSKPPEEKTHGPETFQLQPPLPGRQRGEATRGPLRHPQGPVRQLRPPDLRPDRQLDPGSSHIMAGHPSADRQNPYRRGITPSGQDEQRPSEDPEPGWLPGAQQPKTTLITGVRHSGRRHAWRRHPDQDLQTALPSTSTRSSHAFHATNSHVATGV